LLHHLDQNPSGFCRVAHFPQGMQRERAPTETANKIYYRRFLAGSRVECVANLASQDASEIRRAERVVTIDDSDRREVTVPDVQRMADSVYNAADGKAQPLTQWIGLRE